MCMLVYLKLLGLFSTCACLDKARLTAQTNRLVFKYFNTFNIQYFVTAFSLHIYVNTFA